VDACDEQYLVQSGTGRRALQSAHARECRPLPRAPSEPRNHAANLNEEQEDDTSGALENVLCASAVRLAATAIAAVLPTPAAVVASSARRTERVQPPEGKFIDVSGVRVHYVDEGSGPPLVLIHGNAMSSQDFVASGIVARLAERHRVMLFDRPGFGYTDRPRGTAWTPIRQAKLLHQALTKLEVIAPIVLGHSLGALVSIALAIGHPGYVRALVLLSGYYYPTMPFASPLLAVPVMPVIEDIMRFTVSPVLAWLAESVLTEQLFAPAPVPERFLAYRLSTAQHRSQIWASMEDASFVNHTAKRLQGHYSELTVPVEILAGDGDKIVNTVAHSERLAHDLPTAHFSAVPDAGHMIHYIAPERVMAAVHAVTRSARETAE